eukprot:8633950-Pyramimonas_sp.AAC.1
MAPGVANFSRGPDAREHLEAAIQEVKADARWAIEQGWIQKAEAEPENKQKCPTYWGPNERLYCSAEA